MSLQSREFFWLESEVGGQGVGERAGGPARQVGGAGTGPALAGGKGGGGGGEMGPAGGIWNGEQPSADLTAGGETRASVLHPRELDSPRT